MTATPWAAKLITAFGLTAAMVLAPPAAATPPRPSAAIAMSDGANGEVLLERPVLPLRIVVSEDGITQLNLAASLVEMVPGKAEFELARPKPIYRAAVKASRDREASVEVPLKGLRPGEWLLELRLVGSVGTDGFSDVQQRSLTVDANGAIRMATPAQRKLKADAGRQQAFDAARRKDDRLQPIRLLFGDTAAVPANAKLGDGAKLIDPGKRIALRPAALTPYLRERSVDSTATTDAAQDSITVRGRFMFQDIDGVFKPLVNAAIHLWDSDTFGDEHLGMVATDWDGRWSFTVNNDDGWLQDGRDIYYTIKLDNSRLSLGTCNFLAGAYEWKSAVHDNLSDGTVLDFGTETVSTDMNAPRVWSTLNLAWNHAVSNGGFDPGKIDGCFPGSATMFNGKINIAAGDFDGPDSITHEYGHGVMARAYSGGDPSPGGAHGFGDCGQNQALSWSEGWATAFMLTLRQDGRYNWHEGDGGRAIEAFSSSCQTGESSEGRVAAALLDMFDTANDSNGGNLNLGRNGASDNNAASPVALATMLRDTMVGTQHSTVIAFWNDLGGELNSSQRPGAQTVMNYNWMPVLLPSSCVATKVATANLGDADSDSLLGGLRRFRDQAMLPWPGGRELANIYYRNSPEIALILLRNPALVPDALAVMKHFSNMGDLLTTHQRFLPFSQADGPVVPREAADAVQRIVKALAAQGSDSLKRDAERISAEMNRLADTPLSALQKRAADEKAASVKTGAPLAPLRRQEYAPSSKEALSDKRLQELLRRAYAPR